MASTNDYVRQPEFQEIRDMLSDLTTAVATLSTTTATSAVEIQHIRKTVDTMSSDIKMHDRRLGNGDVEFTSMKKDIEVLQTTVNPLKTTVTELDKQVSFLKWIGGSLATLIAVLANFRHILGFFNGFFKS